MLDLRDVVVSDRLAAFSGRLKLNLTRDMEWQVEAHRVRSHWFRFDAELHPGLAVQVALDEVSPGSIGPASWPAISAGIVADRSGRRVCLDTGEVS